MTTRLHCDRCDKPFDTDAQPGDKVKCPHCADVNIVRATSHGKAVTPAPDRAAAAGYPPATGPETDVLRIRPAMLRAKPLRFFGLWVGVVLGVVGGIMLLAPMLPAAIACFILAVACGLVLSVWKFYTLHDRLRITTRRIVDREGLFSKRTSEILIKDIRNVVVNQTFWQRLWGVGSVAISSAAADNGIDIEMSDVPRPEEVKRVLDFYR